MKMYKENYGFNNFNKKMMLSLFSVCIFFFVAFLSVGFSAFQTTLIMSDISAEIKFDTDARVSNFKVASINNSAVGSNTDYNYNRIYGNILLPNSDSSVTYEVEVVNLGNTKVGISNITELDPSLKYTLTDYAVGQPIIDEDNQYTLGATMKFYITIQYADGATPVSTEQSFNLVFDFREFHSVTYHGLPGEEAFPTEIMDGFDLVLNTQLTSIDRLKVTQDTVFLVNGEHYVYDEENKILTVKSVGGDLLLSYRETSYLLNLSSDSAYYKDPKYKTNIKNIAFVNYVDIENAEATYDLSQNKDNSIIGWIENNGDTTYDLFIGSVYDIYTKNFSWAFASMTGVETINFKNLNTSESTSFAYTFYETQVTHLDLSTFNTSSATTMVDMFAGMTKLETLDVSNFNTANVTNMWYMFGGLTKITELDISTFDTSSVTNMSYMFSGMSNLKELKLGKNFNTSQVTNMESMFMGVSSITSLDLSTFKTTNLTTTKNMFYNCSNITTLDLSTFNTENVSTMTGMFYGMYKLQNLNISTFNTAKVLYMDQMFTDCASLANLDVTHFNTQKVLNMQEMFSGMAALKSLDLSNFVLTRTTNMTQFLYNCRLLENLDLRQASFTTVNAYNNLFYGIKSSITIIVKDADAQTWVQDKLGTGKGTIILVTDLETGTEGETGTETTT